MKWEVRISDRAYKQLKKMDPGHRRIILTWLAKHIQGCENPRLHGKALSGNHAGKWRYRVGEYRIIVEIADQELIVLALKIGHLPTFAGHAMRGIPINRWAISKVI